MGRAKRILADKRQQKERYEEISLDYLCLWSYFIWMDRALILAFCLAEWGLSRAVHIPVFKLLVLINILFLLMIAVVTLYKYHICNKE